MQWGTQMAVLRPIEPDYDVDRRGSKRSMALFRPALLGTPKLQSFCLVRNISSTGLMATIYAPWQANQSLSVRFNEAIELHGTVVWRKDDKLGLEFDEAIGVDDLLIRLGNRDCPRTAYRSPRLAIEAPGRFLSHGSVHQLQVLDISQRGLKALTSWTSIREGDDGTLAVSGLQPRKAVVRWIRDGKAGLYFLDPIGFSELGQWVLDYQERMG